MADHHLAPFFEGVDMKRQKNKQAMFLTYVFGGGPAKWDGPAMFATHAHLIRERGLKLLHFNRVCQHLLDTLLELGVAEADVEEVGRIALSLEPMFDPAQYDKNAEAAGLPKLAAAKQPPAHAAPDSLYTRIGGAPAVQAAVEIFYKKVMADGLLSPYFSGVDMGRQRAKQVAFISFAFGGPGKYTGRDMVAAHEHLIRNAGLGLPHFDAVAGHLVATLHELSVPQPLIDEATAIVMSTRDVFDPARYGIKAAA
uniref:Group 1 truncated hemoglobin n=2 Tax=Chlamydomonas leiostraca TaxID=1034604 RepID=A0A7S0X1C6_9CHLO|mmetsp:Transcript_8007/g.20010  ORF Transcript_8007/g.20010 Transcript_8007/m.20010 type:complete len:254 (+) Transcript_8007:70-831(+)